MNNEWSLSSLYDGFETEKFQNDFKKFNSSVTELTDYAKRELAAAADSAKKLSGYLKQYIDIINLAETLISYAHLRTAVNCDDTEAAKYADVLEQAAACLAEPDALFSAFIAKLGGNELNAAIETDSFLREHAFALNETLLKARYIKTPEEETIIANLENTGSSAWEKLRDSLTATLMINITVDGEEKQEPLSVVRNYAHKANGLLREAAYNAELKAYPKIEKSIAACLNSIKGEALYISAFRGYTSPLDMTLKNARMNEQTLQSLLNAIKGSLPIFRKFLRHKARLLNKDGGLPFCDLFAPLGSCEIYTFEQAKQIVSDTFNAFSASLGELANQAFNENWIDVYPRKGKVGGAFCSSVHPLAQSRVLLNFGGAFSDITTLAHELGHAYHNACLRKQTVINSSYTMPIAETASTFCETLVTAHTLKNASKQTALTALDEALTSATQVIADIYSRYLFETRVFEQRQKGSLSTAALCELMTEAQKEAYGDGISTYHPYAWIPKSHYYYVHHNFYNFPYAFGFLFAKGLYALYLEQGAEFTDKYEKMLAHTGKTNLEDIGKIAGFDITGEAFWNMALGIVADEINEFCAL